MMTLNEKLAHLRKKEGLSQIEVSEKLAVSRQAVSRWESGESRPSTDNLQALCKLYHVPLDHLLDDDTGIPSSIETNGTKKDQISETGQKKSADRGKRILIIGACVALILLALVAIIHIRGEKRNKRVGDMAVEENDQYPSVGVSIDR